MRINLLPAEYLPAPRFNLKRVFILALSAFLVFASLPGAVYFFFQMNRGRETLQMLTQQEEALQPKKAEADQVEGRLAAIQKDFNNVADIKKAYPDYVGFLQFISNALVDEVWLKSISFSQGNIVLEGNSLSVALIGDVLRNLDQGDFAAVRLANVTAQANESLTYYSFTINIQAKNGGVPYAQK